MFAVLGASHLVLSVKKKEVAALAKCLWLLYTEKGVISQEVYVRRAQYIKQKPKSFSSRVLVKSAVYSLQSLYANKVSLLVMVCTSAGMFNKIHHHKNDLICF